MSLDVEPTRCFLGLRTVLHSLSHSTGPGRVVEEGLVQTLHHLQRVRLGRGIRCLGSVAVRHIHSEGVGEDEELITHIREMTHMLHLVVSVADEPLVI